MQLPIESLNLQILNIGLAKHNADWNWKDVSSPFTRIFCVTEGEANLHLPQGSWHLTPGHLYIVPPYTTHSYECSGRFNLYYLHLYEGYKKETDIFEYYEFPTEVEVQKGDLEMLTYMCERHPEARLPESNPLSYDNHATFISYVQRYQELPLYEKMQLRGNTLILISRFMQQAALRQWTRDERITRVINYIHNNIYRNLSVDELSDVACVTKPYLIRIFKNNFGIAPLQYINKKKIERAELMLITSEETIKELAYRLGFNDHSYFIRLFKKEVGLTPQTYREQMR